MSRVGLALWCLGLICIAQGSTRAAPPERPKVKYDAMVLSGDPMPQDSALQFGAFPYHSYVADGNYTVFFASTNSGPFANPDYLFLHHKKTIEPVAVAGQQAPGEAEGVVISSFDINNHRANSLGQVVFESYLAGPELMQPGDEHTNAWASWFYSNGQFTKVIQSRAPAPGIPDAVIEYPNRITLDDLGNVALASNLDGPGITPENNAALWYGPPGNLSILARAGDAVPGHPENHFSAAYGFDKPVLSPNGHVAFGAHIAGNGLTDYDEGVLVGTPGHLAVALMTGEPAPGLPGLVVRSTRTHTDVDVNNRGEVCFTAIFDDSTRALYAGAPGELRMIAHTTEPSPGIAGGTFDFFYGADINDKGEVAFLADTIPTDEYRHAIYLDHPRKGLELIAAKDQHAPGTEAGVVFAGWFSYPVINRDGQVAFFASLSGEGSRGENDYAIFATGHAGDLRLVARYGDEFEVEPGDFRTIEALSYAGLYGAHVLTFNEESNLSFLMKFTDGSQGIFAATVLPEPAGLALLVFAIVFLWRRRRTAD